jgi:hypothetical protein
MENYERELIRKHINEANYDYFITQSNQIDWVSISGTINITEDFANKFIKLLDLEKILMINQFSEDFFLQHKNKLNWSSISFLQKLSDDFVKKNMKLIDTEMLMYNHYISEEIKLIIKNNNI